MYFDRRLWQLTRGLRGRILLAIAIGLAAAALGIARFALLGALLARVFSGAGAAAIAMIAFGVAGQLFQVSKNGSQQCLAGLGSGRNTGELGIHGEDFVGESPDRVEALMGALCLVPGGDAPALSRAIGRFAADPGLCRRIGQWGREHARQFDVDRLAPRLEAIYQEAFNRRRAVRTNCVSETT
jgi:hypothetical protein